MIMKIKKIILFLALAIFTVIPSKKNNTQAQVYFSQIDSEDTFASEVNYTYIIIAPDWVLVFQECPGIFGFCA
tara:strand:- start:5656 stop:5874 length:219 start_codon:yes stop_codon:yes gene_type:complete